MRRLLGEIAADSRLSGCSWVNEAMKHFDAHTSVHENLVQFLSNMLVAVFKELLMCVDQNSNMLLAVDVETSQLWVDLFALPM
eukprot:4926258-Amphidinium_carterae.1